MVSIRIQCSMRLCFACIKQKQPLQHLTASTRAATAASNTIVLEHCRRTLAAGREEWKDAGNLGGTANQQRLRGPPGRTGEICQMRARPRTSSGFWGARRARIYFSAMNYGNISTFTETRPGWPFDLYQYHSSHLSQEQSSARPISSSPESKTFLKKRICSEVAVSMLPITGYGIWSARGELKTRLVNAAGAELCLEEHLMVLAEQK